MKEKINSIPVPVIVVVVLALLGLAGYMAFRTVKSQDGAYIAPTDRNRYMEKMKEQAAQNQGQGYRTSGDRSSMQGRPGAGGPPGGYGRMGR